MIRIFALLLLLCLALAACQTVPNPAQTSKTIAFASRTNISEPTSLPTITPESTPKPAPQPQGFSRIAIAVTRDGQWIS